MSHPTEAFRARYRTTIHPRYTPWLHAGFVLVYAITCITVAWSSTTQITALQGLIVLHSLAITLRACRGCARCTACMPCITAVS